MPRTFPTGGWLALVVCLATSSVATAQLSPAQWAESMTLSAGFSQRVWYGSDPSSPEAHSEEFGTLKGILEYGSAGRPEIIAKESASGTSSGYSGTTHGALTTEFRVVETSAPPMSLTYVPITVTAEGYVESAGSGCVDFYVCNQARAIVHFGVWTSGATYEDSTESWVGARENINLTKVVPALVNRVFTMNITANAYVSKVFGSTVSATADISCAVAVSSDLIPGTESRYSDFFQIEYSPGYWALGNPTPVAPTTWGKIKSLYSNP